MTLTNIEMEWYKEHQYEIEDVIDDDNDLGDYLETVDAYNLKAKEWNRIVFYILYTYRGIDGFFTLTCGEGRDIRTHLMPSYDLVDYDWAQDFCDDFCVDGMMDRHKIAKCIRNGIELEAITEGIREEVARCFEECYTDYDVE